MNPGPDLQEMIATIRTDAASTDPLDQLAAASRTVAELEAVADATLGHFVDQCRRAGRSWSEISAALGVSKQAAHKRFSLGSPKLDRYTPRARTALRAAAAAARALGHGYIGTEHLLLGLFEPSEAIAARVLADTGITRAEVEVQVLVVTPRGAAVLGADEPDPPLTPLAAESLERAGAEALALGHNYVGTEHLLLAQFGDPASLATKLLTELGATHADFRNRVVEKLSGFTAPSPRARDEGRGRDSKPAR